MSLDLKELEKYGPVRITDTTFRDGHQSTLATRFRTEDMLPIAEKLDRVGYWSLEIWGGATFAKAIQLYRSHGLRHLPVVDEQSHLVGMLSIRNVLGELIEL